MIGPIILAALAIILLAWIVSAVFWWCVDCPSLPLLLRLWRAFTFVPYSILPQCTWRWIEDRVFDRFYPPARAPSPAAWFDPALNSAADLAAGKLTIDYDFSIIDAERPR